MKVIKKNKASKIFSDIISLVYIVFNKKLRLLSIEDHKNYIFKNNKGIKNRLTF